MRFLTAAFLGAALAAATATASLAAPKLVYRIDSVTAKIVKGHLVVLAKGAVTSGGWTRPRLHLLPHAAEAPIQVIEFQASPPLDNAVVIQALLPIETTAVFPLPHYGTVTVKVKAESNTVSVGIE